MVFLQLSVQITGIHITVINLVGIVPVQVVQLYLYEVPVIFVVHGKYLVKYRFLTMEGETKVADASCLTLFHQEVHHAVINITTIKLIHASTNSMQQIVVDIVYLQFLQGFLVHADTCLTCL